MVVTMNYRLGPFGFLSMGSEDVPGNAGFRDQVLALERIQELIGIFKHNSLGSTTTPILCLR